MSTNPALLLLSAAVLASTSLAQGDECNTATPLPLGTTAFDTTAATLSPEFWPCAGGGGPDIWYTFTAANAASYTFETCGSTYDTALQSFEGTCAALVELQCNDDACGLSSSLTQNLMPGESVFVRVGGFGGATGTGSLLVTETIVPPGVGSTAAWLAEVNAGTTPLYTNSDLFEPIVDNIGAPTGTNGMTYEFVVYGDNNGRSTGLMGVLGPAAGSSAGLKFEQFDDTLQYGVTEFGVADFTFGGGFNTPGVDQHLVFVADVVGGVTELFVDGVSFGVAASVPILSGDQGIGMIYRPGGQNIDVMARGRIRGVAVYDGLMPLSEILAHRDAYFTGSLGMRYCTPAPANSTGVGAEMIASGSTSVADNLLTLGCVSMPRLSFSFFITSLTQGFVANPNGSQGNLCVSGAIGRFVGPGQIQQSNQAGEISLLIDLTQHPTPTGLVFVQAGQSWNYQAWYRDAVGGVATSNFSDGLRIMFQ